VGNRERRFNNVLALCGKGKAPWRASDLNRGRFGAMDEWLYSQIVLGKVWPKLIIISVLVLQVSSERLLTITVITWGAAPECSLTTIGNCGHFWERFLCKMLLCKRDVIV
jgi:hypothetical protein